MLAFNSKLRVCGFAPRLLQYGTVLLVNDVVVVENHDDSVAASWKITPLLSDINGKKPNFAVNFYIRRKTFGVYRHWIWEEKEREHPLLEAVEITWPWRLRERL